MIINQSGGSENLKTELTQQDSLLLELDQILNTKMSAPPEDLSAELSTQDDLIADIMTALEGKAAGGSGGGVSLEWKQLPLIEAYAAEPVPDVGSSFLISDPELLTAACVLIRYESNAAKHHACIVPLGMISYSGANSIYLFDYDNRISSVNFSDGELYGSFTVASSAKIEYLIIPYLTGPTGLFNI